MELRARMPADQVAGPRSGKIWAGRTPCPASRVGMGQGRGGVLEGGGFPSGHANDKRVAGRDARGPKLRPPSQSRRAGG